MADKIQTIPQEKIGRSFGHLEAEAMTAVQRALAVFLGFA